MIDPGHGGFDYGWEGFGLRESDIAYDLAARIEGRLGATGVRAYLSRGRDQGPDELARAAFANETDANLCVSLHTDGSMNPAAQGVATYFYGNDLHGASSSVGEQFAGLVQREIVARTDLLNCRTHAKTWDLLRRTKMPAVRLEIGYVTNPHDSSRLADPAFRDVDRRGDRGRHPARLPPAGAGRRHRHAPLRPTHGVTISRLRSPIAPHPHTPFAWQTHQFAWWTHRLVGSTPGIRLTNPRTDGSARQFGGSASEMGWGQYAEQQSRDLQGPRLEFALRVILEFDLGEDAVEAAG